MRDAGMPAIHLDGRVLYYTQKKADSTSYPPLVLIHGAGGSRLDWPAELRRLPGPRVIALDLSGHGRSTGTGHTDTQRYADEVCALLDALHIKRAVIAGHSMGGAIAQQIGIHHPAYAAGLILLGTGSKLPIDPSLPQRIIEDAAQTLDWIVNWSWSADTLADVKALSRERLAAVAPEVLRNDYLACQRFDVRDQLDQITVPTLVLAGADDRMVKLKFSQTLAERIPDAVLVVFQGGHMFPLEKSREVAATIVEWLQERAW
jgi:pimeloyl-ACP methyl ester carboxylesterase